MIEVGFHPEGHILETEENARKEKKNDESGVIDVIMKAGHRSWVTYRMSL